MLRLFDRLHAERPVYPMGGVGQIPPSKIRAELDAEGIELAWMRGEYFFFIEALDAEFCSLQARDEEHHKLLPVQRPVWRRGDDGEWIPVEVTRSGKPVE